MTSLHDQKLVNSLVADVASQSPAELRANLARAIATEHQATADVLRYLAEYEARELHLRDGFSSIYTFLTKGHGYSEGAAARRCNVARFARKYPAVLSEISGGRLSLSVVDLIARAASRGDVREDQLGSLFDFCARKSKSEAEGILARMGGGPVAPVRRESVRAVSVKVAAPAQIGDPQNTAFGSGFNFDEPRRPVEASEIDAAEVDTAHADAPVPQMPQEFHLSLRLAAAAMDQLRRAQELMGTPDLASTIERLATFHNERKDPMRAPMRKASRPTTPPAAVRGEKGTPPPAAVKKEKGSTPPAAVTSPMKDTPPAAVTSKPVGTPPAAVVRSRYIPAVVRREVFRRAGGQCSYVDAASGRRCQERRSLQVDHIQPWACGGPNDSENLQLLCRAHNMMRARDTFGRDAITRAIETRN